MIKAAAYIRVSTQEQKLHGLSLDAQKMKLKEYADKNDMIITGWYVDAGVSGRKKIRNRPELQRMINESGSFNHVIFIKLDRFFRSVAEYHECMKLLKGVTWSATEEEYDLTTANGRMLVNMKLTIAELEADQTGERIKLVNEYKVREGLPLTRQPFYYKNVPNGKFKKIEKNNEERLADLIDHFKRYQSLQQTAMYINSKYGTTYQPQYIKKIMRDTRLYGEYKGNPDYYPAYMTRAEWERLQEILPKQMKINSHRTYLFRGIIFCQDCNGRLSGLAQRGRNKTKHKCYVCKASRITGRCTNTHTYSEAKIERQLLALIEPMFEEHKRYVARHKDDIVDTKPLENELKRLNYSWQKGRIEVEEYDKRYMEITTKLKTMQEAQIKPVARDLTRIEEILNSDWKTVYSALDESHKQAFWRNLLKEIRLDFDENKRLGSRVDSVVFNDYP